MKNQIKNNLWKILGVAPGSSKQKVDSVYRNKKSLKDDKKVRLAWKILRDPYYSLAYDQYQSVEIIKQAGFFDDGRGLENDDINAPDLSWFTTPVQKIINNLKLATKNQPLAALLATGGFSPIHNGHLEMMEVAKQELKRQGFAVLGGYISPSHDGYVSTKYGGDAEFNYAHRLRICEEAVSGSDWLMVDAWESRYVKVPITLTDVILRLEAYLKKHIPTNQQINVVYVFGSDNAGFSRAFIGKGKCVCVLRDGYEEVVDQLCHEPAIKQNKNIIFAPKVEKEISSSLIRKGIYEKMPKNAELLYSNWRENQKNKTVVRTSNGLYTIRNESNWAVSPWFARRTKGQVIKTKEEFFREFLKNLKGTFLNVKLPDMPMRLDVEIYNLEDQEKFVKKLAESENILNLDVCTNKTFNKLNLSRAFNLSDGQCFSNFLVSRPGYPSVQKQLDAIPSGLYALVEDDMASGYTIKNTLKLLPKRIRISKLVILSEYSKKLSTKRNLQFIDIVDFRDFLAGSRDGGLVVILPDSKVVRAPYMLPYVSPAARAKIPPSKEVEFSINMWKLNAKFFRKIRPAILLKETSLAFQNLMKYLGFREGDSMVDICNWHVKKLSASVNEQ